MTTQAPAPAAPPASLRTFFVLWVGQALSTLGTQAVQFGIVWWLTIRTGSAAVLATGSLIGLLPPVLMGPLSGALVDRLPRRWVMFWADTITAIASAGLGLLFLTGRATPAWVFTLLFVRSFGNTFQSPAWTATTALMVSRDRLTRIQGLNQTFQGAMLIVSAPIGAMLVAALPMASVMAVDWGTAAFAVVPLLFIRVPEATRTAGGPRPGLLRQVRDGFEYLRARPGHLGLVSLAAVVNLFLVPAFSLLPLLVKGTLRGDAAELGGVTAAFGVGMISGGALLGAWGGFRRRIVTTLAGLIALGLAVLSLAVAPPSRPLWPGVSMFLVGALVPIVNGPILAIFQATIEPRLQGRVFSMVGSLSALAAPLGLMLAAPIAELLGVRVWYLAGAMAAVTMGMTGLFSRGVLSIEEAPVAVAGCPNVAAAEAVSQAREV